MTAPTAVSQRAGWMGLVLVRFLVPLWVLAGATTKLVERSPKLLPEHLRGLLENIGLDLHIALSIFLTIEFAAIAVMVLVPRLARITAVFMLGVFSLVLLYEIFNGNVTSCGCLGSISPPPWLMLSIDLGLLILVAALPVRPLQLASERVAWGLATILAVALGIVSFTRVVGGATGVRIIIEPSSNEVNPPQTAQLPAYYSLDTSDWPGQRTEDIDLISWIPNLPDSINDGQQYLILYSRTCEHCHELLLEHFSFDPPAPTTLVAIPESVDGFIEDGQLENPCIDCAELDMPVGVDWLMTPPVVIAIEDGVIRCAQEAEDGMMPQCLPWHGY
ncbi:MAG: hypothetical protein QF781_09015 [Phycisphaerales bacterium]|nr:hypothetical protein [Phycisphaerales bacterium]MDP6312279.1 hypothetical protein [Phycisphaerales bacterium]MDP7188912.1 hypothetical protein [Phycisphaerales bacterium]MDP7519196.1 hypothetical protein [Phycisphaerales bacterium]HJN80514.1 hypothetical protein [Phycisphaerales bacterium]